MCCTFDYFFMSETHVASSPIDSEILYIFNTVRFIVSEVNIYIKNSVLSCHLKYFEYWYQFTWKKCGESNCFINGGIWPGVFQFYWSASHFPCSEANNSFCTFLKTIFFLVMFNFKITAFLSYRCTSTRWHSYKLNDSSIFIALRHLSSPHLDNHPEHPSLQ